MSKLNPGFQSRAANQSFWLLLTGILCIFALGLSIFGTYLSYGRRGAISRNRLANEVIRTVFIAKSISPNKLPHRIWLLNQPHIRLQLNTQSSPKAHQITPLSIKTLRQYINQHPNHFLITVPLAKNNWLTIRWRRPRHSWLLTGVIVSCCILLLALIILCFWAIRRLALPLNLFAEAARRFGRDVEAPPLAEQGSSDMRHVIQAFNKMQSRIRRLLHDRTQMLAAISHDLRTPITRLQLRAEYLKGTSQYEKAIADLEEMEAMIASILSFARDYIRTESAERFDINALLTSLCDDMMDLNQAVSYESDGQRTPFYGRITALKRAFNNLIGNGVKYGEQVEVTLKSVDQCLQITISDLGPGISEEEMHKVFTPFYRVDPARSPEKSGTGLGLTVARDIILAHGGDIKLANRKPHGLIVLVTLPIAH